MDALGDRMKMYERVEAERMAMPLLPVLARLDGRAFSSFTRGMERPYDVRMHACMLTTTKKLVEETNAVCGYTQSDEITLAWYSPNMKTQIYFDGRIQKMVSTLAAYCSVIFNELLAIELPEYKHKTPTFDCRVWQVPTLVEAANAFQWREFDATKNSISMAAQSVFSHKQLHKKHTGEMQEMLFQKGIYWNDYPDWFKRGSYVQRRKRIGKISPEELETLPPLHHARKNPDMEFERHEVRRLDLPPLSKISNPVDVLFWGMDPLEF